jgi:cytochrome c-type biogenesis protein CcmH/NrfF
LTDWPSTLFLLWFIAGWVERYGKFVQMYPYCRRKLWAAFLMDYTPAFVDAYAWLTVNTESWMTRDDSQESNMLEDQSVKAD